MKKLLFTPGPLSTSATVKEAMLEDMGSRDHAFVNAVKEIRYELLELANVTTEEGYQCVIIQGSGTFAVESVISSVVGQKDVLLTSPHLRARPAACSAYPLRQSPTAARPRGCPRSTC